MADSICNGTAPANCAIFAEPNGTRFRLAVDLVFRDFSCCEAARVVRACSAGTTNPITLRFADQSQTITLYRPADVPGTAQVTWDCEGWVVVLE